MTVKKLIKALEQLPPDKNVWVIYDGTWGYIVRHAWVSRRGDVAICGAGQPVYETETRPVNAPTADEDWNTPEGEPL